MIYFITNEKKQAPWQEEYENLYYRELKLKGVARTSIDINAFPGNLNIQSSDFVWVMHYEDIQKVAGSRAIVVAQSNGTSACTWSAGVQRSSEQADMRIIDISLAFNEAHQKALQKCFPGTHHAIVGFPVEVDHILTAGIERRPKTIVVPGRIAHGKQVELAIYLLQPLIQQGYKVIFCLPNKKSSIEFCSTDLCQRWQELGFIFEILDRTYYLQTAAQSEFVFTCSLSDTMNVSLVEALICGCYPLVPRLDTELPTYWSYVDVGYEPFSRTSLMELVKRKPQFSVEMIHFDPDQCAKRVLNVMNEYLNRKS